MKRRLVLAVLMGLMMCAPQAFAAARTAQGVENRIIVAFKLGTPAAEQRQIATANGLTVIDEIPSLAVLLVSAPAGLSAQSRARLTANPKVYRADSDAWLKWIESDAGQGATFLFTLPFHVGEVAEASAVRTKASAAQTTPWWKKILGLK